MLPKKERLTRKEFNRFFSLGKRFHSPTFQIVYTPSQELHASVVVPKKIIRRAVERNKIRRRIYDIVRHYRTDTAVKGVFIFLAKSSVGSMSYATLKEEINTNLHKIITRNN